MTVTPKARALLLAGALVLTLVAGFSADGGDQADLVISNGEHGRKTGAGHTPARDGGEDVPTIAINRNPPSEEMNDVFRSTSWYVPPPPPEPAPPSPPPLPFTYIGMMHEKAGRVIFLSNQDNNYAIRKGDVIEGTYRVEEANEREVVLTYLPLDMKQNMHIGGRN